MFPPSSITHTQRTPHVEEMIEGHPVIEENEFIGKLSKGLENY